MGEKKREETCRFASEKRKASQWKVSRAHTCACKMEKIEKNLLNHAPIDTYTVCSFTENSSEKMNLIINLYTLYCLVK